MEEGFSFNQGGIVRLLFNLHRGLREGATEVYGMSLNRSFFLFLTFCISILLLQSCSAQKSGSKLEASPTTKLEKPSRKPAAQASFQERIPIRVDYLTPLSSIRNPEIFVYKEKRRLYIVESGILVRDYPIGLGFSPRGDKEKDGDGRTPEGSFRVFVRNPESRFVKSIGLNPDLKQNGGAPLPKASLTSRDLHHILVSFEKKISLPRNGAPGGKTFIHAGGAHSDWTDGCIALYKSDMEELFQIAGVGTPVSIRP